MIGAIRTRREGFLPDELPTPKAWRTSEVRILEQHYPTGGAKRCAALLPNRSPQTIRQRAYALRIKREFAA
jgi:hypothetical protein